MSAFQSVYLEPKHITSRGPDYVPVGVALFRLKVDDQRNQRPFSICELFPQDSGMSLYDCVGVLSDPFQKSHLSMPNKTYNATPNLSTNVVLLLDDKNTTKIPFGERIYFVEKTISEGHIPKGVWVATTADRVAAGKTKIFAGILAIEYNQNPNRQITVNLNIGS